VIKLINSSIIISFLLLAGMATGAHASSLESVKKHGAVRCGVDGDLPGFSARDANGNWKGMDVDMCRAVAAAVFGDAGKVELIPVSADDRFSALASGKFDVLTRNTTWNLSRDTGLDVTFVGINYFDGQGFMIRKSAGVRSALGLNGVTVCAEKGTTHVANLGDYFMLNRMTYKVKTYDSAKAMLEAYKKGMCAVVSSDQSALYALRTRLADPGGSRILPEVISKEPLGPVVATGNANWAKIVRWSLFVMLNAEEAGISIDNVSQVRTVSKKPAVRRLLGLEKNSASNMGLDQEWAYNIISQVGNYADSFNRNIGKASALKVRRGLNALWRDGGLHYAPPIN
jgi:general L-amino acid transport system substrate-binding protein